MEFSLLARGNVFWPAALVGEADSVNFLSASAYQIDMRGQKALALAQRRYSTVVHVKKELLPRNAQPGVAFFQGQVWIDCKIRREVDG